MEKKEIIERISELRTKAHLSARMLSIKIGKNEGYINRMESKKDFLPTIESLNDILEVCNSSFEEFFYYDLLEFSKDKYIIDLLKNCNDKKKNIVLEILKM